MADSDRLDHLRLAQRRIVAKLDDPKTPPYSIAPLSNQLRLVEKDIARLTADENVDEGLPDPEYFGFVTALAFERWLRGRSVPPRRRPNDFADRQGEIFQTWKKAGFELTPRAEPVDEWVEENRVQLVECLEVQP